MENDDQPVGRLLTRREMLTLFGVTSAALLAACSGAGNRQPTDPAAPSAPGSSPANVATSPANVATSPANVPTSPANVATSPASIPTAVESTPFDTGMVVTPVEQTPGAGLPITGELPACVARPEQTEGPYFRDDRLNRSDIRSDPEDGTIKEGLPLLLAFRVSQISAERCTPLAGAMVDIWQCDAQGVYAGVNDRFSTNASANQKHLRGYQLTDANGLAQFVTIYPGWYPGRTVHIHFKIRTDPDAARGYDFTSQLYFDDNLTDQVMAQPPYNQRGERPTRNSGDFLFRAGGEQLVLALTPAEQGYTAVFDIGLQIET